MSGLSQLGRDGGERLMPFAGYDDHDDCVSSNSDKNDPDAYCAAIRHRVEKAIEEGEVSDELAALITASDEADVSEEASQHWEEKMLYLDDSPASEEELNSLSEETKEVSRHETDSFVSWTSASEDTTIYKSVEADDDGDTPRGKADEDSVQDAATDLFYVTSDEMDGKVVGIGVDFPNSGVYVDWINEAWPEDEQLDEPHVSDYGSIADLEQATGNDVTLVEHVEFDGLGEKAEFEPSVLGTDGVPGDRQSFESFLDALVDAGADVFTVRNSELQVWPEDNIDDADPHLQVVGIPDSEVLEILERFNLDFMNTPEVTDDSNN